MPFILTLIIGAAIGYVATRVMKIETNIAVTVAIGVLGAILGMFLLRNLAAVAAMGYGILPMFVGGVGGALIILWIYKKFFTKG
jgi:uncharacterized membrane protein YeaQ/YmgE (transglycosylase-associated protein family)